LKIAAVQVDLVHLIINQPPIQVSFGIVRLASQALIEICKCQLIFSQLVIGIPAIVVGGNVSGIQLYGLAVIRDCFTVLF
jgi:hypothetical protein